MPVKTLDFTSDRGGLVKDSNPFTLADTEWSDLLNVRIRNRAVSKIAGESQLLEIDQQPRFSTFLNGAISANKFYYYISSAGRTYRVNASGNETEVTKGAGGTPDPLATGVKYQMNQVNGGYVLMVNDGDTTPQYITSVGNGTNTTELTDIPGWNYDTDSFTDRKAGVIRPFKYVMVAGNITQTDATDSSVDRLGGTIVVSNQAAPGALPTWDPNAAGADTADEFELSENGEIREMVSLADNLMILTEDDIYALRLTASTTTPVVVSKVLSGRGILAADCAVEFFGRLFVVGNEDIYVFQGAANTTSVSEGRVRDYFFSNLSGTYAENTFVRHNERFDEIWVCYPSTASEGGECDRALIWNYTNNTWTERELDHAYPGAYGPTIANNAFVLSDYHLVLPSNRSSTDNDLLLIDDGTTFSGNSFSAHVERRSLDLAPGSMTVSKWTSELGFFISSPTDGASVNVSLRSTSTSEAGRNVDFSSDTDQYLSQAEFDLDTHISLHPSQQSKFINFRIEGTDQWSLHRMQVEYEGGDVRSE